MFRYDAVLFDLDGTIIDTNQLIIETVQYVMRKNYGKTLPLDLVIANMGRPLEDQFQTFTGEEEVAELIADYRKFNYDAHDEFVKPFPHVVEVLTELKSRGIRTGAVTTKMRASSIRSLEFCGLDKLLDTLVTVDDVEHPKPHPEPVLKAIEELQVDADRTIMVGDSPYDIQAAQAAGASSVAVGWSMRGEDVLKTYDPHFVIHDMKEILPIVGIDL